MRRFGLLALALVCLLAACAALPGIRLGASLTGHFGAVESPPTGSLVYVAQRSACSDGLPSTETYCDGVVFAAAQAGVDGASASLSDIRLYGARSYALELVTMLNAGLPVVDLPGDVRVLKIEETPSADIVILELATLPDAEQAGTQERSAVFGRRACDVSSCIVALSAGFPADLATLRARGVVWSDDALRCASLLGSGCEARDASALAALIQASSAQNALSGPFDAGFLFYRPS